MRLWVALLAVVPACGFESNAPGGGPDGGPVVNDDAPVIPPDAPPVCYGTFAPVCFPTAPTAVVVVSTTITIDTGSSPMCDATHDRRDRYCVIAGATFTIAALTTLRAFGSKPLVLIAASGLFDLAGIIDVSSKVTINAGAGGNSDDCANGTAATMSSGGFGGSFGGRGGDGKPIDGAGGMASLALTSFPSGLRGGCRGGTGAGEDGGTGGNGGGAVAITAPRILITGQVNASGSGGRGGGPKKCGGGGGGSGGMIVLDSPMITGSGAASLFANGGGGGQGGELRTDGEGGNGSESTGPGQPGLGGTDGANGGGGANGASEPAVKDGDTAGGAASSQGGGGGGGGASGFIRASGATGTITIAPSSDPA